MQLTAQNIGRTYGAFKALDDVNLEVQPGEFLTLLGPSGSGKTTFLNIVAGFTAPTSGTLEFGGKMITNMPPEDRNFGMVFQGYALFPNMTVADNIGFPLRVRKWSKAKRHERVGELLERIGLSAHSHKYPSQLSGGQQQRVALARALSFSPDMLLLDEPLSALDLNMREQLQVELKRVHEEFKTTFLFVTHDQSEALSMSSRIAIFNEGKVLQVGTPHEVYTAPSSKFVAEFIGHFNLFPLTEASVDNKVTSGAFGGQTLSAPANSFSGNVLVGVRPENVSIKPSEPAGNHNSVPARIVGQSYHGSSVLLTVQTLAEDHEYPLRVVMPYLEWSERSGSWGENIWLTWAIENSVIVPG